MTAATTAWFWMALMLGSASAWAGAQCNCRSDGQYFVQGQVICLRGKLQRCVMSLNNPSWTVIAEACPESTLGTPMPVVADLLQPPKSK